MDAQILDQPVAEFGLLSRRRANASGLFDTLGASLGAVANDVTAAAHTAFAGSATAAAQRRILAHYPSLFGPVKPDRALAFLALAAHDGVTCAPGFLPSWYAPTDPQSPWRNPVGRDIGGRAWYSVPADQFPAAGGFELGALAPQMVAWIEGALRISFAPVIPLEVGGQTALDILGGKNPTDAFNAAMAMGWRELQRAIEAYGQLSPYVAFALSFVPMVGQGLSAAVSCAGALARGEPLSAALVNAALSAVPGGAFSSSAVKGVATGIVGVVNGETPLEAVHDGLDVALRESPGLGAAVQTTIALLAGQNLQNALLRAAAENFPALAQKGGPALARLLDDPGLSALRPDLLAARLGVDPSRLDEVLGTFGELSDEAKRFGEGPFGPYVNLISSRVQPLAGQMLRGQELHGKSARELVDLMGAGALSIDEAKSAMAALVAGALRSAGQRVSAFDLPVIKSNIGDGDSLDDVMGAYGSHVAPIAMSPKPNWSKIAPLSLGQAKRIAQTANAAARSGSAPLLLAAAGGLVAWLALRRSHR